STDYMLGVLSHVRTGPERLKGGLMLGWSIAHKTGTGQDFKGASIGINDIGLMTAPDGHQFAVAVFIPYTRQPNTYRLAMMQAVSQAVSDQWAGKPFALPQMKPVLTLAKAKHRRAGP